MLGSKIYRISLALFIWLCASGVLSAQTSSKTAKIPDATLVPLSLQDSLSSATNKVDDPVVFEVAEDVRAGDVVVIPRGSKARGHVVEVKPKTLLGRSGKLDFTAESVKTPGGADVRLRANSTRTGQDTASSLLLAPFNLVLGAKDVEIPKGTRFRTYVDGDQEISLGGPAAPPQEPPAVVQPVQPPPAQEPSTVVVKSTPQGADITVDGKYMGSTPSTLQLPPGEHAVAIEKSGYQPWRRSMSVNAGGIVTIDATLEPQ